MGSCVSVSKSCSIEESTANYIADNERVKPTSEAKTTSKAIVNTIPDAVDSLEKATSVEAVEEVSSSCDGLNILSFHTTELSLSINSRETIFPQYSRNPPLSDESSNEVPYLSSSENSSRRGSSSSGTSSVFRAPTPEHETYPDPEIED